jgi:hypothetical protein
LRDYGIVSPKFWIGQTGKQLRAHPIAQVVALYLMTSPHSTMTGVFHLPILYVSHETGIPHKGASKALARLIQVGFCEYEAPSETVFVIRMAAHQIAESLSPGDKRVLGLKREVERMPSPLMRQRFLQVYGLAFHLVPPDWTPSPLEAPYIAPSKPGSGSGARSGSEQDQDQTRDASQLKLHESLPRANWDEWISHRRHKKWPVDPTTLGKQLKLLARLTTEEQIDSIEKSINAGWQGLFEPKVQNGAGHKTKFARTMEALDRAS